MRKLDNNTMKIILALLALLGIGVICIGVYIVITLKINVVHTQTNNYYYYDTRETDD